MTVEALKRPPLSCKGIKAWTPPPGHKWTDFNLASMPPAGGVRLSWLEAKWRFNALRYPVLFPRHRTPKTAWEALPSPQIATWLGFLIHNVIGVTNQDWEVAWNILEPWLYSGSKFPKLTPPPRLDPAPTLAPGYGYLLQLLSGEYPTKKFKFGGDDHDWFLLLLANRRLNTIARIDGVLVAQDPYDDDWIEFHSDLTARLHAATLNAYPQFRK